MSQDDDRISIIVRDGIFDTISNVIIENETGNGFGVGSGIFLSPPSMLATQFSLRGGW